MNFIYALQDPTNPNSLAKRLRRARARHIEGLIDEIHAIKGRCRIIDLGGTQKYWRLFHREFLTDRHVSITLVNQLPQPGGDNLFRPTLGDACNLDFDDGEFDLAHSNSVIEHVGDWSNMEAFAKETRRVADRYYVQTPYFWFPVEPHFSEPFFHWRGEQSRAKHLLRTRPGYRDIGHAMRAVQSARLLDKAQFNHLFPDARHVDERFAGLTKSLIAIRG